MSYFNSLESSEEKLHWLAKDFYFRDAIQKTLTSKRPCWVFSNGNHSKQNLTPLNTKISGQPYLEKLKDWPKNENEKPYSFEGQINFEELPKLNGLGYPKRGLLTFYKNDQYSDERRLICRWFPDPKLENAVNPDKSLYNPKEEALCYTVSETMDFQYWKESSRIDKDLDELEYIVDDLYDIESNVAGSLASYTKASHKYDAYGSVQSLFYPEERYNPEKTWLKLWTLEENNRCFYLLIAEEDFALGNFNNCLLSYSDY